MPVLMIEAKFPDRNAFNRGQFYRTILKLLGEQTYPQQMQVDIHAEAAAPKRRRLTRSASESNDDPDEAQMLLMLPCSSMECACFLSMRPITYSTEKREREEVCFRNNWSG
jgi:hypothetical protein